MGYRFSLDDINIVAYLTAEKLSKKSTPRITYEQLASFVYSLYYGLEDPYQDIFISPKDDWTPKMTKIVNEAKERFEALKSPPWNPRGIENFRDAFTFQQNQFVSQDTITRVLGGLRKELSRFDLYGLPVDQTGGRIFKLAERFAKALRGRGLFLLPIEGYKNHPEKIQSLQFLDPFPAVQALANADLQRPGMLLWTQTGEATYETNEDTLNLHLTRLPDLLKSEFMDTFRRLVSGDGTFRRHILHLSDLHFGTPTAYENRTRLKNELRSSKHAWDQVVITGDLFEVINDRDAIDFDDFRNDLRSITGRDILVVPGNHDQNYLGNRFGFVGKSLNGIAKLEWTRLKVDDRARCVHLCFDSSLDSKFAATGVFSESERNAVEDAFNTCVLENPKIDEYFRVVLIHHHPFSFETDQESIIQRALKVFGHSDERFLAMTNSELLIKWCANMRVSLILHGHKHVQRHFVSEVVNKFGDTIPLHAVGCGTSLGAENYPLTYNTVAYNDETKNFSVTFYEDDRTGGGFVPVKIALQIVK